MQVVWTPRALNSLKKIGIYIAKDSPVAAEKVTETIFSRVDILLDSPEIGRIGRVRGTRELVISNTPYIVPYRIKGNIIQIIAVYHGAQKYPDII